MSKTRTVALFATAGVTGILATTAIASASETTAPTAPTAPTASTGSPAAASTSATSSSGQHRARHHAGPFRRGLHGEFVAKTKTGTETLLVQRGVVTAASPTSVTLRSADDYTHTYAIDKNSRVRIAGKKATANQVVTGHHAAVVAVQSTGTVRRLVERKQ